MQVVIVTLTRPTHQSIHAHDAGCRDVKRHYGPGKRYGVSESETIDALSVQSVVEFVFCDIITDDSESQWTDYRDELNFFPCTSALASLNKNEEGKQ